MDLFSVFWEGEFLLKVFVIELDLEKWVEIKVVLEGLLFFVFVFVLNLIDIMNEGIDKVKGFIYFVENGYINFDLIIVFGDNENDVGMIELVEIGVVMENGILLVLEKVDKIVKYYDIGGLGLFM